MGIGGPALLELTPTGTMVIKQKEIKGLNVLMRDRWGACEHTARGWGH